MNTNAIAKHGAWIIVLFGVVAYSNALQGQYVFDSVYSVRDNPHIRKPWPLSEAMSLAMANDDETVSRRPLLSLSFAVNRFLLGPKAWGFRLGNLAIHILASLLLFGIVRRTLCLPKLRERWAGRSGSVALAVAVIWLVHPLQTESVTYIAQRAESLMGMLYLLTLYCAVRGFEGGSRIWFAASVLACAAGMAVKEVMITAPVIVLLYEWTFMTREKGAALAHPGCSEAAGVVSSPHHPFRQKVPDPFFGRWPFYAALAATWAVFATVILMGLTEATKDFTMRSPIAYALTQPLVILYYLRLSVWPDPLVLNYAWDYASAAEIVVPGCVIVLLLSLTAWGIAKRTWFGFLGAWFFLILGPSSSFVSLQQILAEHRMYLSLAAVITLAVVAAAHLLSRPALGLDDRRRSIVATMLLLLVALTLTAQTHRRNYDYHNAVSMWSDVLETQTDSANAYYRLGLRYARQGKLQKAAEAYEQAVRLAPDFAEALTNLGVLFQRQGKLKQAADHYRKALRFEHDGRNHMLHFNLGCVLLDQNKLNQAAAHFAHAIRLKPKYAIAHNNLGLVFLRQQRLRDALVHFEEAYRISGNEFFRQNMQRVRLELTKNR